MYFKYKCRRGLQRRYLLMTTFEKSLLHLVKGVYSIEEFCERIVKGAIAETIAILSNKYGLDEPALVSELVEPLVARHARMTSGCQTCKAITYRGKKCAQDAVAGGYCQLHSRQRLDKNVKKRSGGQSHREGDDTVAKVMRLLTSAKQTSVEDRPPSAVSPSVCRKSSPTLQ
jgi:hypothetical protein